MLWFDDIHIFKYNLHVELEKDEMIILIEKAVSQNNCII